MTESWLQNPADEPYNPERLHAPWYTLALSELGTVGVDIMAWLVDRPLPGAFAHRYHICF